MRTSTKHLLDKIKTPPRAGFFNENFKTSIPEPKQIQTWLNQTTKIGGAICIHHADRVITAVSGMRSKLSDDAVQLSDPFHIGSLTKSFTALATLQRLQTHLHIPLTDFLEANRAWNTVTIDHLLTHQSGLNPNCNYYKFRSRQELSETQFAKSLPCKPGEYLYSNLGYVMLGFLMEHLSGKTWETIMEREIFPSLALNSAGFDAPKAPAPFGHRSLFGSTRPVSDLDKYSDNPVIMRPAGNIHMNITDLGRYGKAMLDALNGCASPIHKNEAEWLTRSCVEMGDHMHYGRGWINMPINNHNVIFHNGSNTLWYAFLAIIPSKKIVIAFTTNDGRNIGKKERAILKLLSQIIT